MAQRAGLGPALAVASAALFGASTPLAKLLVAEVDPWLLAGLLYLASGLGLAVFRALRRLTAVRADETPLRRVEWVWLALATAFGGMLGPVLLMLGLARSAATAAALLLNLEGVFTALLAWFVFRENVDRRIALGMAAISAGALVLSWAEVPTLEGVVGPLLIAGACLCWAIDNNLTRKVSLADPVRIALFKGAVAGAVNAMLALRLGAAWPRASALAGAAVVGFLGYGVSLVLFVRALSLVGTARTGAYFSLAPFFGAVVALGALGEPFTIRLGVAGALMAVGLWLHLTERHAHEHEHEPMAHSHRHAHDEHHRHAHEVAESPGGPHTHWHVHAGMRHKHPHDPDAHHQHRHGQA